ncbi:MAG: nuclear transport factor 2 family protein [Gemmatimonadaceae bacterium]
MSQLVGIPERPQSLVAQLLAATNAHDLEAIVDCFADDYHNVTPAHPSRGFTGRAQVRRNWEQMLAFIPDLTATVVRLAIDGDTEWSEWEMRGTRRDGTTHLMRGVILFSVRDGRAESARFYMEPVDHEEINVNEAVNRAVVRATMSG